MSTGTVFTMGGEQFVRLPEDARFSDSVNRVDMRVVGPDRAARWQDESDASER
jgi:virulence-associated protein VagC